MTVPTGITKVRVTAFTPLLGTSGTGQTEMSIWTGASAGTLTTQIGSAQVSSAYEQQGNAIAVHVPSAGSLTYNVALKTSIGTGVITAASTGPAFILVECC